jgi:hypothetical protein
MPAWPSLLKRGVFVALLLLAYVYAWRPARAWVTSHIIHPTLASLETPRAAQYQVTASYLSVDVRASSGGGRSVALRPTAGLLFVLPAVFLLLLFPNEPYWIYLFGYHLVLGTCMVGAVTIGVGWADWGFAVYQFLIGYILKATSLAAPLLPFLLPAHQRDLSAIAPE